MLGTYFTPKYIAPERRHGNGVQNDMLADIYSLGVVMLELFTGRITSDASDHAMNVGSEIILLRTALEGQSPYVIANDDADRVLPDSSLQ